MGIVSSLSIFVWTGRGLESVVLEQVLGEFVNWWNTILSRIASEGLWNNSLIWIDPVTEVVLGTWELVHGGRPATPSLDLLEDLVGLNQVSIIFLIVRVAILQEFHLNEKLILVGSLHN